MPQKRPVNNFGWIKDTSQFNEDLIKYYNEESDDGHFLKLMFNILNNYKELHNDLQSLPEWGYSHDKIEYVIGINSLKQALNHRLLLKKVHKEIEFN